MSTYMDSGDPVPAQPLADATRDCREAIALARSLFQIEGKDFARYELVKVEKLSIDAGENVWRLTFRPLESLASGDEHLSTFGGELFVHVDVAKGRIEGVRYGE